VGKGGVMTTVEGKLLWVRHLVENGIALFVIGEEEPSVRGMPLLHRRRQALYRCIIYA
jgi:hypothetical protein